MPRTISGSWKITIENLTNPEAQPFSPPLFVVHDRRVYVWRTGQIASHAIAAVMEDANNAVAESAYNSLSGVSHAFTGPGGPLAPGTSRSYTVTTNGPFRRLSIVTMLVNTNDGFTGLDSLRLTRQRRTIPTIAYDAGSEKNNQLKAFIPGPCCGNFFVRDPEGAVIRPHPGIQAGVGDLDPAIFGWQNPVAQITVEPTP